jgi:hypothetical protein
VQIVVFRLEAAKNIRFFYKFLLELVEIDEHLHILLVLEELLLVLLMSRAAGSIGRHFGFIESPSVVHVVPVEVSLERQQRNIFSKFLFLLGFTRFFSHQFESLLQPLDFLYLMPNCFAVLGQ